MIHLRNTLSSMALALAVAGPALAMEALPEQPPVPVDNPQTAAKIELGKQLYFDPRLSSSGTVSCNSCHNVMATGTDSIRTSVGVEGKLGGRNAPTVWNAAYLSSQFWDGRAATLEDQAKGPILNPIEMAMPDEDSAVEVIRAIPGYVERFQAVFGGDNPVTYDNIAKAIASYERTLITPNSPFDNYMRGDKKALSPEAERGMKLVQDVGCTACHSGPTFAGPATLATGQPFLQRFPIFLDNEYVSTYKLDVDPGRFESTGKEADRHMWRVPTWRNVALTAPYFHNGSVDTLDEAVRVMGKTQLNIELSEAQVADIVAFLESLTGEIPQQTMPILPMTSGSWIHTGN
ncbi:MAG: cytochrome-c peroxidase [Gammaproteobacteria bacterium]|nr:cytochrome-c peroxidase [Gammaproteobacteria bacterium]